MKNIYHFCKTYVLFLQNNNSFNYLHRMVNRICSIIVFSILVLFVVAQDIGTDRITLGKITDSRLNELSGMVHSMKNPSLFWVHNDSGDSARIFLIDKKASVRCEFSLEGVDVVDTEDIAWFEENGKSFLILADIGDNRGVRKDITLYIFEEPEWNGVQSHDVIANEKIKKIAMRYEDKARDAEALFVDPNDLTAYLISKRDFQVGVYPIDLKAARNNGEFVLKRATSLPMTFITAADISRDGKRILIKNLGQIFYWKREAHESILNVLNNKPDTLAYQAEPQGEAICFGEKQNTFYTVSERPLGLEAYLYEYQILSPAQKN